MNFENFIDDFVDTKINVVLVKFKNTSSFIEERVKTLKIEDSKTPENIDFSIQIIQSMIKNYSSYICLYTVSYMLRNNFFFRYP